MRTFSKKALSVFLSLVFVVGCIIPVAAAGKKFADVKESQWFYSYIDYMAEKNVIKGHDTGLFAPNDKVKRNEFITMINNLFGLTEKADVSFTDVDKGSWYEPYYQAAYKQGYLQRAFGDIVFQTPKKELTREEAVALLMAYLDPDIDVSGQTLDFSDAAEITPMYRNFIAQSVYQGIVIGYDDGTFKPKATLSRAEAATILCKAAGTIVTSGTVTSPETAVSGNAVINDDGTTLGFNVDGDLIITEEVNGNVTVRNSIVNGTVYIRAKKDAKIIFDGCKLADVVIEGDASILLSSGTIVDNLKLEGSSYVIMEGAAITNFTVGATAKNCIVLANSGANSVKNYAIYASGFNSAVLHTGTIVFGEGIKATIANNVYGAAGFKADSLRTSWEGGQEYIRYTAENDGFVDYFYSKTQIVSSVFADRFKDAGASVKSTRAVSVGSTIYEPTIQTAIDYRYIVIGFRAKDGKYVDFKCIDRVVELYGINGDVKAAHSGSGKFTVSFTVGINDNAHKGWKAYYTFTDKKDFGVTDIGQLVQYSEISSGKVFSEADANGKKYIAVFIVENGITHAPKVAEVPVSYNGFIAVPTIIINGGSKKDVLSYSLAGYTYTEVKYFYADEVKDSYVQNEQRFDAEYRAMADKYKGTLRLYGKGTAELKAANSIDGRKYVIICVAGNKPFYITRMYAGTGFANDIAPQAFKIGNERALSFTPSIACTLKYAYVDSDKALTTKQFNDIYANAKVNGSVTGCEKDGARFVKLSTKTGYQDYAYVAVMLTDADGVDYQPICIKFTDPGTGVKSAAFSADLIAKSLKFTATHDFDGVTSNYYYEAFYINSGNINMTAIIDSMKSRTDNVQANTLFETAMAMSEGFEIDSDGKFSRTVLPGDAEKQIALRLVITGTTTYTLKPFVINISKYDYGFNKNTVKFAEKDGRETISLDLEQAGTIKCYYTDSKPVDAASFEKGYSAAIYSYKATVDAAGSVKMGDGFIYELSKYKYVAFMFEDKDGKRTPQIIERPAEHITSVISVRVNPLDYGAVDIYYKLMDVYTDANVTPLCCYMAKKDKQDNVNLSSFTNFKAVIETTTKGEYLIHFDVNSAKDANFVYIVIGVKIGNDTYKFFPYEVDVKELIKQA